MYKNALVSVSDKQGVVECVQALHKVGTRIVSTGGTARALSAAGIPVVSVQKQTGFPEVMDGRVKTLHPHIFLPVLARKNHVQDAKELKDRTLQDFDLVICNLYPFEEFVRSPDKDSIEGIDVGGPSLLRAAAKNFEKITVVCDPEDYSMLQKPLSLEERKALASKVFSYLSVYDCRIADYLHSGGSRKFFSLGGSFYKKLRYGENPKQKAFWHISSDEGGLHQAKVRQGKELSFNNILDLQAAVNVLREFQNTPCFVGIKHNNPCGVACGESLIQAVEKGLKADPLSIFGGITALNQEVDLNTAQALSSIFLEAVVAPSFTDSALKVFSKKKNLRVLSWEQIMQKNDSEFCIHKIDGGFLVQDPDCVSSEELKTDPDIPSQTKADLDMAWKVCTHLKSNAIALVSGGQTVGLGMGQVDRVTAVDLAIQRMHKYHKNLSQAPVMASDGFFPFEDSVKKAAQAGISWIVQPGGSMRDSQVIKTAQSLGVSMLCTGVRHFKH